MPKGHLVLLGTALLLSLSGTGRANTIVNANMSGEDTLYSGANNYVGDGSNTVMYKLYTSKGWTFQRVSDSFDQVWSITSNDGTGEVELSAKFAGATSDFGVVDPNAFQASDVSPVPAFTRLGTITLSGPGDHYTNVSFTNIDTNYAAYKTGSNNTTIIVKNSSSMVTPPPMSIVDPFGFAIKNGSGTFSSIESQNPDTPNPLDHMVTFKLFDGTGAFAGYAIAFEDKSNLSADRDFNDAVLEIRGFSAVPEPSTLALGGLAAVIGLVSMRGRRNRA